MSIAITRSPSGTLNVNDTVTFSIDTGIPNNLYASFKWYLNSELVSIDSVCVLTFETLGAFSIYVEVTEYTEPSWLDGQFYGGRFNGNFSGGTFHYGYLNGSQYENQSIKPKPFIVNNLNMTPHSSRMNQVLQQ